MLTVEQVNVVLQQYIKTAESNALGDEEKAVTEALFKAEHFKIFAKTALVGTMLGGPKAVLEVISLSAYLGYLLGKAAVETRDLEKLMA